MRKRVFMMWLGAAMVLAFGFVAIGCSDGGDPAKDVLHGTTWKGTENGAKPGESADWVTHTVKFIEKKVSWTTSGDRQADYKQYGNYVVSGNTAIVMITGKYEDGDYEDPMTLEAVVSADGKTLTMGGIVFKKQ